MAFMYDYLLQSYNAQYSSNSFYVPLVSIPNIDQSINTDFRLIYNTRSFSSAFSDASQDVSTGSNLWMANIEMRLLTADEGLEWEAFFAKIKGKGGRFMLYDPQQRAINKPMIADTGTTFDDGTGFSDGTEFEATNYDATVYSQTTTRYLTIQVSPTPATFTTFFKAGQKVTVQTQNSDGIISYELKTLTQDVVISNVTGRGVAQFEPPLRVNAKINGAFFFVKPFGLFKLTSDDAYSLDTDYDNNYSISFSAMESV